MGLDGALPLNFADALAVIESGQPFPFAVARPLEEGGADDSKEVVEISEADDDGGGGGGGGVMRSRRGGECSVRLYHTELVVEPLCCCS